MNNAVIEVRGNESDLLYSIYVSEGFIYSFRFTNRGFYTDKFAERIGELPFNLEINIEDLDNLLDKDRNTIQQFLNNYISENEIGILLLNQASEEVFAKCKAAKQIIDKYSLATNKDMKCSEAVRNYCDHLNAYSVEY